MANPSGVTGGDLRVDWNEKTRMFRVYGWFDFPTTTTSDSNYYIDYTLPSGFPSINVAYKYVHMGTPCGVAGSLGLIYGGMTILNSKKLRFHIPFSDVNHVYLPPTIHPIP